MQMEGNHELGGAREQLMMEGLFKNGTGDAREK